jgi:hypothetical protein
MYSYILRPLCDLLSSQLEEPNAVNGFPLQWTYDYCVDLPSGICSVRDIVNFCCIADFNQAFYLVPDFNGKLIICPYFLSYDNPLTPPRAASVKYWELQIGNPTNSIPSYFEISLAISDSDAEKRIAARRFLDATVENYRRMDLVNRENDPVKVIWAALGLKDVESKGTEDDSLYISKMGNVMRVYTQNIDHLNFGLRLLMSMELFRERNDTNLLNWATNGTASDAELGQILPDVCRIAHESKLVRNGLSMIKWDGKLNSAALNELDESNLFVLVAAERK